MIIDCSIVYRFMPVADPSSIWVTGEGCNLSDYDTGDNAEQPMPIPCFRPARGRKWLDCLAGGTIILISERFKQVLEESHITGWKPFEIRLVGRDGNPINGYYWLKVTGKCGPLDASRGRIVERPTMSGNGLIKVHVGDYFAENSWDGSDIFRPAKSGFTFVTEKTKDIIYGNCITNARLERITEIESYST
jgi:hypothetical protein